MGPIELRRILCPINCSDSSRQIVERSSILAALHGAELRLFHVVCDNSRDRDAERLIASMFALTRTLPERARVSAALAYGEPASEIVQHARLARTDLIILGTDQRSSPAQVGTTLAADVAAHAPCPVLHVRLQFLTSLSEQNGGFAEILCCADSLRGSHDGDEYARMLARREHSRVTHVSVLGTGEQATESSETVNIGDGHTHIVNVSLTGCAGLEIIALAGQIQSDLIVMGAAGSTTAYVMTHARCPVLLVPPSSDAPRRQTRDDSVCA